MVSVLDHPYGAFLHRVEKPTRYTGAEHGVCHKDWSRVDARVCLAFPDVYDIGMSHLGFRILYKILNENPRTLAERCYTPWVDMQGELKKNGELLRSLESARVLSDFDVIGFSLQFELTYTNILSMLDLGGIPLRSEHRGDDDPLVIAGGPVATHAEPMAIFFDAILIGDGEEAATEIALAWTDAKRAGLHRKERLERLAALGGVYVPSLYETHRESDTGFLVVDPPASQAPFPVRRRLLEDISRFPFPDDGPVGGPEAIFDRMSIEIARGCTEGCRFCQAGMIYRPVRERDPAEVVATVESALEKTGQDEVSLTALSTADVSSISPLIQRLVEKTAPKRVSLGVASLRAYGLAENLLDDIRTVRAGGLTFAPEAGTQRMRDVINKNVTEEQLLETAERTFSRGFDSMKLYFMIGLPTETDEDVEGIVEVGRNAFAVGKRVGKGRAKVTVSVSTHVPKPHTPFQWCAMDPIEEVHRKQALLKDCARRTRGLGLRMHDPTATVLEGVLARGDRSLGPVIERAYLRGARFDSWDDRLRMDLWQEALEHFAIDSSRFLGTIPIDARLPWDHLDVGLEGGFLAREYRRAVRNRLSPPCGKAVGMFIHHTNATEAEADGRKLVCYDCGVACDLTKMREERVGFLRKMGALEPGGRARLPVVSASDLPAGVVPPPRPRKTSPERYRPAQPGSVPERWRFRFTKTGPMALLGHLDLIRELPRGLRRAGLRLAYTQGFHPKPDMTFGPALSLGVASLDEYVDVKLIDPPTPTEALRRLAESTAPGLRFVEARRLEATDRRVSAMLGRARYVIGVPENALGDRAKPNGARAFVAERIAAFLAQPSVRVKRVIAGIGKIVDVRALVSEAHIGEDDAARRLADAGIVGRLLPIEVTVSIGQGGSAKVSEIVEAVFGDAALPHVAVRTALLGDAGSPMSPAPRALETDQRVESRAAGE